MSTDDFKALKEAKKEFKKQDTKGRMGQAIESIEALGYEVDHSDNEIWFFYKGGNVIFWPYTGWHSGETIKDGRGIKNLIKQIKE